MTKELDKPVIKIELTNKNLFETNTNTNHIKKEELGTGAITIKLMGIIIEQSIMIIVKAILRI